MRLLVCGGRAYSDEARLYAVLDALRDACPDVLMVGCGYDPSDSRFQGADQLAYEWAISRNRVVATYPAEWRKHGLSAGPRRNARMLAEFQPEGVLAFPGGKGTFDMTNRARIAGVLVAEVARS